MATDTASVGSAMPCPDPSAHKHPHGSNLSEAASTAALIAANNHKGAESKESQQQQNVLDADGKLSSRSAATSLKHANAKDLPSFPSTGNTAGSASKAALLAADYKMQELWHPELSEAGSKAALLANQKGAKLDLWQASASADGQSAATLAFRNKGLGPDVYQGNSPDNKNKALMAATMSNNQARQRAGSTPAPVAPAYPDSANSAANALGAATASYRTSTMKTSDGWNSDANQAARIINAKTDRGMYTSDIHFESEEDKHQAALRASAMSMAKQIYETQNRSVMMADPDGGAGADAAMSRSQAAPQTDIKLEAMRYIHLQEAAHKLAAERLAKVDKNLEESRYRQYYGYEDKPKRLSRMSMRSSGPSQGRNRANSESTRDFSDSDDEMQANRIRSQMSKLNSGINTVDAKKQQDDRARLMAAAEKRVSARMQDMDAKVFADTGKVSPAMQEQWEAKARERAEKDRELRAQNPGKTHIGGGKFMDDAEIEAIAAARLKPTLDEINDTAEKRRARDEEIRQIKQEQERVKMEETAKKQAQKEEFKRIKEHDKAIAQKEKEEEKARKNEEKQRAREEQRKSREVQRDTVAAGAAGATLAEVADKVKDDDEPAQETTNAGVERHRSAISRLKDRFRKSGAPGESTTHHDDDVKTTPTTTAVAAVPEPKDESADQERDETPPPMPISPVTVREDSTAPRASSEQSDSKWQPVSVPSIEAADAIIVGSSADAPAVTVEDTDDKPARPTFEQHPSSGFLNDHAADSSTTDMPSLERHITEIPESDSSDGEADEDRRGSLGKSNARIIADRVGTAPVPNKPEEDPLPTTDKTDETLPVTEEKVAEKETAPVAVAATKDETPATAAAATTSTTPAVTKTTAGEKHDDVTTTEKDKKGVRGLFSKLRHRRDHSDAKPTSSSSTTTPATKSSSGKIPEAAGALTFPPDSVLAKNTASGKFLDDDDADNDSDDSDDTRRGRAPEGKKLGFGNSRTTRGGAAATGGDDVTTDGEEQFEEARDHFDESLAPPPTFTAEAEGKKSSSPSRETKFVEEL